MINSGQKSSVIKKAVTVSNSVCVIDEDPNGPREMWPHFDEFEPVKSVQEIRIDIYFHPRKSSRLIVLMPDLEPWFKHFAEQADINHDDYGIPEIAFLEKNPGLKPYLTQFREMKNELINKNGPIQLLKDELLKDDLTT